MMKKGVGSKKNLQNIHIWWIIVLPPPLLSTPAKVNNIHNKEFFHPHSLTPLFLSTFINISNIFFFLLLFFKIKISTFARYRLNTTKNVFKLPKKASKNALIQQKFLFSLSGCPPPCLFTFFLN